MTYEHDALSELFSAYLHQDWGDEFSDEFSAVKAMIESEPQASVSQASIEIDGLLRSNLSEEEIAEVIMDQVGCYYDPASANQSYRDWLAAVSRQLKGYAR